MVVLAKVIVVHREDVVVFAWPFGVPRQDNFRSKTRNTTENNLN